MARRNLMAPVELSISINRPWHRVSNSIALIIVAVLAASTLAKGTYALGIAYCIFDRMCCLVSSISEFALK